MCGATQLASTACLEDRRARAPAPVRRLAACRRRRERSPLVGPTIRSGRAAAARGPSDFAPCRAAVADRLTACSPRATGASVTSAFHRRVPSPFAGSPHGRPHGLGARTFHLEASHREPRQRPLDQSIPSAAVRQVTSPRRRASTSAPASPEVASLTARRTCVGVSDARGRKAACGGNVSRRSPSTSAPRSRSKFSAASRRATRRRQAPSLGRAISSRRVISRPSRCPRTHPVSLYGAFASGHRTYSAAATGACVPMGFTHPAEKEFRFRQALPPSSRSARGLGGGVLSTMSRNSLSTELPPDPSLVAPLCGCPQRAFSCPTLLSSIRPRAWASAKVGRRVVAAWIPTTDSHAVDEEIHRSHADVVVGSEGHVVCGTRRPFARWTLDDVDRRG